MGSNSATNAGVEVAAFSVSRALGGGLRGGAAGLIVQPVVWAISGNGPDAADVFIYGTSAAGVVGGAIVAVPAIVTGVIKNAIDDQNDSRLAEARNDEPRAVRGGMTKADDFSFWASMNHIQAMTIASKGGVCWQHPNGVYTYLEDAAGFAVCDYAPTRWKRLYKPLIPLQRNGDGVNWQYRER